MRKVCTHGFVPLRFTISGGGVGRNWPQVSTSPSSPGHVGAGKRIRDACLVKYMGDQCALFELDSLGRVDATMDTARGGHFTL